MRKVVRGPGGSKWVKSLVGAIHRGLRLKEPKLGRDGEEFSVFMIPILEAVLRTGDREPGAVGGYLLPLGRTAAGLMLQPKTLRRYLRALAQAGIIKAVSRYDAQTKVRAPLEIIVAPDIAGSYARRAVVETTLLGWRAADLFLARRAALPVQGFTGEPTVPWGHLLPSGSRHHPYTGGALL